MAKTLQRPPFVLVLVLLLAAAVRVKSEVFSGSSDLSGAFQLERQVVNVLQQLLTHSEMKINSIRQ